MTFFSKMTPIYSIRDVTNPQYFRAIPRDWIIAVSDVRGSTRAIEQGRYKEVNALAAASIVAILNELDRVEVPFVFGGDGSTIVMPSDYYEVAERALASTRNMARTVFQLDLRVGIVPVIDVINAGYSLTVAKLWYSENHQQAIFNGGGLSYAETLVKTFPEQYAISEDTHADYLADFTGFECRWTKIPSPSKEVICLIVRALGSTYEIKATYDDVIHFIETTYGDQKTRHPITVENMQLATFPHNFRTEAGIKYRDVGWRTLLKLAYNTFLARIAMRFNIQDWGRYKSLFVEATDHEKFDDNLRMVITGDAEARQKLEIYLEELYQAKRIAYGIHADNYSLVTCLIDNHFGKQVHFVDVASGGYALAAQQMKKQLGVADTMTVQAIKVS